MMVERRIAALMAGKSATVSKVLRGGVALSTRLGPVALKAGRRMQVGESVDREEIAEMVGTTYGPGAAQAARGRPVSQRLFESLFDRPLKSTAAPRLK